jgi:hypothetical protein
MPRSNKPLDLTTQSLSRADLELGTARELLVDTHSVAADGCLYFTANQL